MKLEDDKQVKPVKNLWAYVEWSTSDLFIQTSISSCT